MRIAIVGVCLCWPLLLLVPGNKPILYVVESDSCPPCRAFQNSWTNTPGFADRLRSGYDVRGLHWENVEQRAQAQRMGVSALPSFVMFSRDGRRLGMIEGYSSEYALLTELRLPPLTRQISQQRTQPAQPAPSLDSAATPRGVSPRDPEPPRPTTDEAARREIQRLEQSMQSLQRQLRDVGKPPESSEELQSLRRTVEDLKAAAAKSAAAAGSQLREQLPVTPILTPDAPPGSSSGLLALALKVGTTLLLPEVAIPTGAISIAATVGGWWLGRRRRNQRQRIPEQHCNSGGGNCDTQHRGGGTATNSTRLVPIAVESPPPPQLVHTETRFVDVEKDSFAQAHAWAIAELVRKYPGSQSFAETLASLIKQFLNGKKGT